MLFQKISSRYLLFTAVVIGFTLFTQAKERLLPTQICVYGETPAGVMAAVQAAKLGKKVVLLSTTNHVGGVATSGLTATDLNNYRVLGGVSLDFYKRVYQYYREPSAWRSEDRSVFFERSKKRTFSGKNDSLQIQWVYESGVGEGIFKQMLNDAGVTVLYNEKIDLKQRRYNIKNTLKQIRMNSGLVIQADMFIDASYEGDLLKVAGISYIVGRESNETYDETMNGIRLGPVVGRDSVSIDPYIVPGEPSSGLLPFIEKRLWGAEGSADNRTQTYCYRITLTNDSLNSVEFKKPKDYNPLWYEFLARMIALNPDISLSSILSFTPMPNKKTDTNQGNFVGNSYDWAEADHTKRIAIAARHRSYSLGLLWFLSNDDRVPEPLRNEMKQWGLPKDEFHDTDNFPHQLYIREARRMISDYVMTEANCNGLKPVEDPIAVATYPLDCHFVSRVVDVSGKVRVEGSYGKQPSTRYGISFRSIIPKTTECTNMLVPVCVSASHVAYSSIRMEPVYMMLGQAAATAAVLAIDAGKTVQELQYSDLKEQLSNQGQVMHLSKK